MGAASSSVDPLDRILLVLDDVVQAKSVARTLRKGGYQTRTCSRDKVLGRPIRGGPFDLAIVDLRSLSGTEIDLIDWIKRHDPYNVILVLGGSGTPTEALRDMTYGGTFGVPRDVAADALLAVVAEALKAREKRWGSGGRPLRRSIDEAFDEVIAESPAMRAAIEQARDAAKSTRNLLIRGPTGSGKEVLARCVHRASPRRDECFMVINCSAVPSTLVESELFGQVKSACWGPPPHWRLRPGMIQQADHGTLFVDEFAELVDADLTKLLDTIDARSVVPVGRGRPSVFDVRFIFASNRDLDGEIAAGRLNRALYERLDAVELMAPSLAERREDILPLAEYFRARFVSHYGRPEVIFSAEVIDLLLGYAWPGNVRELRYEVEHAVVVTTTSEIVRGDLSPRMLAGLSA